MGVYYGMNGLWVPIGGQGASIDSNLVAENIKSGVTISGITGTFTNDGTATASDIASGATAYVNGAKVTGIISTYTSSGGNWAGNTFKSLVASWLGNWENQTDDIITVVADANYNTLLRKDAGLHVNVPKSEFGDATAADVASGKTFTSSAGLKMTGTKESIPMSSVNIVNNASSVTVLCVYATDKGDIHRYDISGSTSQSINTEHPLFIIYKTTASISFSCSGVSDIGYRTDYTFADLYIRGFKPTDTTATITIS